MVLYSRYRWPGNVRQLANVMRTGVALLEDGEETLTLAQLGDDLQEALEGASASASDAVRRAGGGDLREQAEAHIRETLAAVGGNVSEAARRLGVSRNTLYRRIGRSTRVGVSDGV